MLCLVPCACSRYSRIDDMCAATTGIASTTHTMTYRKIRNAPHTNTNAHVQIIRAPTYADGVCVESTPCRLRCVCRACTKWSKCVMGIWRTLVCFAQTKESYFRRKSIRRNFARGIELHACWALSALMAMMCVCLPCIPCNGHQQHEARQTRGRRRNREDEKKERKKKLRNSRLVYRIEQVVGNKLIVMRCKRYDLTAKRNSRQAIYVPY